jgi:hypothetical protein
MGGHVKGWSARPLDCRVETLFAPRNDKVWDDWVAKVMEGVA